MIPRAIRNNNPLNIRRTGRDQWKGLSNLQKDTQFCQFETMEQGWRAVFVLLTRTYYHQHGLFTIRGIITRWAPPQDHNDTEAYIRNVSRLTGIQPDEPLGIPSMQPARWLMLGAAMHIQESGITNIDYFAMLRGWAMAREK